MRRRTGDAWRPQQAVHRPKKTERPPLPSRGRAPAATSSPRLAPRAATAMRERVGCYILAMIHPSRRSRSNHLRKAAGAHPLPMAPPSSEETNIKRLPSKDLASLAGVGSPRQSPAGVVWPVGL